MVTNQSCTEDKPISQDSVATFTTTLPADSEHGEPSNFHKVEVLGWKMPGNGSMRESCGQIRFKGCLNVDKHHNALLKEGREGKAYIKAYRANCGKASCPTCYELWASAEAKRAEYRLSCLRKLGKVIHVICSIHRDKCCPVDYFDVKFRELRHECEETLRKRGFWGGMLVFHPFRRHSSLCTWHWSPHFHAIGYGWIRGGYDGKWVIKNLGVRRSVCRTISYILTHCGIRERSHSVVWFGRLAYNKLIIPEYQPHPELCPMCGSRLVKLRYVGDHDPPPNVGEFYGELEDWVELMS